MSIYYSFIQVLVEGQLQGKLEINSTKGTEVAISWKEQEAYASNPTSPQP